MIKLIILGAVLICVVDYACCKSSAEIKRRKAIKSVLGHEAFKGEENG